MRVCIVLAALAITFIIASKSDAARLMTPCTPCLTMEECERPPVELCVFGEARNACNRKVCAKGPDERCGGPMNILGECGEGLRCHSDERCHGCHIDTMSCSKL